MCVWFSSTIFGHKCLSGCVRIVFMHLWLCHSCLKTNSNTFAEAHVDKDSDGKSYTHSCCSWTVTNIQIWQKIGKNPYHLSIVDWEECVQVWYVEEQYENSEDDCENGYEHHYSETWEVGQCKKPHFGSACCQHGRQTSYRGHLEREKYIYFSFLVCFLVFF